MGKNISGSNSVNLDTSSKRKFLLERKKKMPFRLIISLVALVVNSYLLKLYSEQPRSGIIVDFNYIIFIPIYLIAVPLSIYYALNWLYVTIMLRSTK